MAVIRMFNFPPERGYIYVDKQCIIEIYYQRIGEHFVLHRSILMEPDPKKSILRFHRCPEIIEVVDGKLDEMTVDNRCLEILKSMSDVDATVWGQDTKV